MKPLEEVTVLIGEGSNHHHVVTVDKNSEALFCEMPDGRVFVNVLKGTVTLNHLLMPARTKADHEPITVGAGVWRFWSQREYDEMGDRKVID